MTLLRHVTITGLGLILLTFAPIRGDDALTTRSGFVIEQKLSSIVVSIDFSDAKIDQAIGALSAMSKQLDPEHVGVQFVVTPEASTSARPITLKLDKVPLKVALHYVCELAHMHSKTYEFSVAITPLNGDEDLVKRTFLVDPSFVAEATKEGLIPAQKTP